MQIRKSAVPAQYHFRPIVEPCSADCSIVQSKAGGADDVERNVVAAQSRAMFPVLGGISGSTSVTRIIGRRRITKEAFTASIFSVLKYKRNDEIRLKCSSFLLKGLLACRSLCAPVGGCCSNVKVRTISSWLPSCRPSWLPSSHLFSLTSFHLF